MRRIWCLIIVLLSLALAAAATPASAATTGSTSYDEVLDPVLVST